MPKKGTLLLFVCLSWSIGLTQVVSLGLDPAKRISQYYHRIWTTQDGLPSNSIQAMVLDADHYLWLGTFSGLVRFDGVSFATYDAANEHAFHNNAVMSLATDSKGRLWAGTQAGIVIREGQHFSRDQALQEIDNHYIEELCRDRQGRMWIGTAAGLFVVNGATLRGVAEIGRLSVSCIREDGAGTLWVGGEQGRLFSLAPGQQQFQELKMPSNIEDIISVNRDRQGRVMIGTHSGVMVVQGNTCVPIAGLEKLYFSTMLTDSAGTLWMGGDVLARYKADNTLEHNPDNRHFITSMLADHQGLLWAGTKNGGLHCYSDGLFQCFTEAEGMRDNVARAICQIDDHTLWIGYEEGGIDELKDGLVSRVSYVPNNLRIKHMMRDSQGVVWISTYQGLYRKIGNRLERWAISAGLVEDNSVRMTHIDTQGSLWIGTRLSGLFRYRKDHTWTHYTTKEGLGADFIMALCEGPDGEMLVGTKAGFDVLKDGQNIVHYGMEQGLPGNVVFSIRRDGGTGYWIAVQGGLCHYSAGNLRVYSPANGLVSTNCYDVVRAAGSLWVPTAVGVMQIREQSLLTLDPRSGKKVTPVLYGKGDGMKEAECLGATFSMIDNIGNIWFCTNGGLASINPGITMGQRIPTIVHVEEIRLDSTIFYPNKNPIIIPASNSRFAISFTAIDYRAPERLLFRYKLPPFEQEWVSLGYNRTVSFTNLGHGQYTFWLEASSDGIHWRPAGMPIVLIQQKPFYRRILFQVAMVCLLLLLGVVFYQLRLRAIEASQRRLEAEVEARTEEIRSQAEQIAMQNDELRTLSNEKNYMMSIVAHDVRTPLNHIRGLVDVIFTDDANLTEMQRTFLAQIGKSAEKLGEMTSQILDIRSVESNALQIQISEQDLVPIVMRSVEAFRKDAGTKSIHLEYEPEIQTASAWCNRDYLKLVLDNLLSNAIKFSPHGSTVHIHTRQHGTEALILVADEGPGIRPEEVSKLFGRFQRLSAQPTGGEKSTGLGLSIAKKYVETMKGRIWVESEPGKGATFAVAFPLSQPS